MSRRLLTEDQVERVASRAADAVLELVWLERPELDLGVEFAFARLLREAIQHDLTDTLEGLREEAS